MTNMSSMDYVVTSRFHGVVFAHLLNKPVLAISDHHCVRNLIDNLGLSPYCLSLVDSGSDDLHNAFLSMVDAGAAREASLAIDAVGPDVFEFCELVRTVRQAVGARCLVVGLPPELALAGAGLFGLLVRDVVLTRSEVHELMSGVLVSRGPSTCPTSFASWIQGAAPALGLTWSSELGRHFR